MKTVFRLFDRLIYMMIFLCIAGFVTLSFAQVIFRFVLNNSITWSEEMCRYLFVWMVFLGSGIGLLHRRHITIDIVPNLVPEKIRKFYNALIDLVVIGFTILLIRYGIVFAGRGMNQFSPAMQIPLGYVYSGIVIGGVVMLVNALRSMLAAIFALPVQPDPEPAPAPEMTQREFNELLGIEADGKGE